MVEGVAAQEDRHLVLLDQRLVRIAREAHRRQQRRLARSPVVRRMRAPRLRHAPLEVRQPPRERQPQSRGSLLVASVELVQRIRELALRGAHVARTDVGRHQLMV